MRYLLATLSCVVAFPALAQMSVTTFGATDAVLCYQNAADDFSRDSTPCDQALRTALTGDDRKKTFVNRGIIRNREGRLGDAIEDFDAALALDGGLAEAFLNRGNSHYLGGRYGEAVGDYEESLRLGVRKPWAAWYNIGLAKDALNDKEGARAAYQKALETNPDFFQARQKLDGR